MKEGCTIYRTVDFISKRWTLLILLELYKRPKIKRYSQIKNNLNRITPKILSLRLKELEKVGLITKKIHTKKFPIRCEYALTKSGEDFIKIIKDIKKWTLRWKESNKICEDIDCKECEL